MTGKRKQKNTNTQIKYNKQMIQISIKIMKNYKLHFKNKKKRHKI